MIQAAAKRGESAERPWRRRRYYYDCPFREQHGAGYDGGGSLDDALGELETGNADAVVVLENDLHRHASATRVNAALAKAPLVMVVDHQRTAIMENAHLVLSAASFAESDGTVINNEGRRAALLPGL
ncbi:NADH dehydrogenase I chain G [Salmonella enterica subsp. enterica]|uniref:NADH dehydrogenase I chain G n=1 Tax=Salmonella enterica I TaxID=59201 RepID=A0A379USL4_SALET|nr:NADH dehydrogenase I chain G [Salmonella enterica subsp. enterica]